jgi:hypothetical protein
MGKKHIKKIKPLKLATDSSSQIAGPGNGGNGNGNGCIPTI